MNISKEMAISDKYQFLDHLKSSNESYDMDKLDDNKKSSYSIFRRGANTKREKMEEKYKNDIEYFKEQVPKQLEEFNEINDLVASYLYKLNKDPNNEKLFAQIENIVQDGFNNVIRAEKNALLSDTYFLDKALYNDRKIEKYDSSFGRFTDIIYRELPEDIEKFKNSVNNFIKSNPTYEDLKNFFMKKDTTFEFFRIRRSSEEYIKWLADFNSDRFMGWFFGGFKR
ncbi:hypothetical protein Mia14_0414 [Candidatus Mancarchaeum acidiphilum]|uniref:Uncharacterized protein n=1 Tax=Candidatus Mancarchaeum acidiphilum TaxID=1920749 RepID=A0A218NMP5_9ARCH|nr:hypothetical protein [Candidatus Mancarchaeum acidiphilum]ASI13733.1 hypothetical protein Mia14_0414 [Candidatus Mancarchaeum acidiphilum]